MTKVLLIDNYDSFTYNLKDYLEQAGLNIEVVRNDAISMEDIKEKAFSAFVLSPGPGKPSEVPILNQIIEYSIENNIPLLGICLGHQAIGEYFNLPITKADIPVHGKTDQLVVEKSHPVFTDIPVPIHVMRYHSLIVSGEPSNLQVVARNQAGIVMAMAHKKYPIFSMQYHPESILTTHGLQMLKNWKSTYLN